LKDKKRIIEDTCSELNQKFEALAALKTGTPGVLEPAQKLTKTLAGLQDDLHMQTHEYFNTYPIFLQERASLVERLGSTGSG